MEARSLRLKYFKKFLKNKLPIMEYYMGPYLKDYNTFNNKIPHYCGVLPKFYNNLKKY